jgi:hypothetical protein
MSGQGYMRLDSGEVLPVQYSAPVPLSRIRQSKSGVATRSAAPAAVVERVPDPFRVDCVAFVDVADRSITLRVSDLESGYAKMWYRQAFRQLQTAEELGYSDHPTVWASTPSKAQVAWAVTTDTDFYRLKFSFPRGETAYQDLISKPVTASVFVDRNSGRFMNVALKNKR